MFNFLMPEKPELVYFFNIDIMFALGFIANLDETGATDEAIWIPLGDHINYERYIGKVPLSHKNLSFKISVNNIEISNNDLDNAEMHVQSHHKFEFSKESNTNQIEFKILGFDQSHMLLLPNGLGARPAIKIEKINFEDVNVLTIFTEQSKFKFNDQETVGDFMFSCNGISTFDFDTPIYRWLLQNRQLINCYKM
jgi:hypothetical protein